MKRTNKAAQVNRMRQKQTRTKQPKNKPKRKKTPQHSSPIGNKSPSKTTTKKREEKYDEPKKADGQAEANNKSGRNENEINHRPEHTDSSA